MQSKISFFNKTLYAKNLKNCLWIMLVMLVYRIGSLALMAMGFLQDGYTDSSLKDTFSNYGEAMHSSAFFYINVVSDQGVVILTAILAIVAVVVAFSYLYSTKTGYMISSFPVTRLELFGTGVIAVVTTFAIPLLVSLIGNIVIGLSVGIENAIGLAFGGFVSQLVATLFFVAFAACVAMTSGQLFVAIIFYAIFNVCYAGMVTAIRMLADVACFGTNGIDLLRINSPLTPMLYIPNNMLTKARVVQVGEVFKIELDGGSMLVTGGYFIATLALLALGYFLYKKKHMETVQDFISVPILKPVFRWCVSFFTAVMVVTVFMQLVMELVPMSHNVTVFFVMILSILLGAILFVACQMLTMRSFRVFSNSFIKETLVFSGIVFVIFMALRIDAFGIERRVPEIENIRSIQINSCGEPATLAAERDADEIAKLVEFHKKMVECREDLKKLSVKPMSMKYISIVYYLDNDKMLNRYYMLPDEMVSDGYKRTYDEFSELVGNPDFVLRHKMYRTSESDSVDKVHAIGFSFDKYFNSKAVYDAVYQETMNYDDVADEIYKAFISDVKVGAYNWVYTGNYDDVFVQELHFSLEGEDGERLSLDGGLRTWTYYDEYGNLIEKEEPTHAYFRFTADAKNTIAALIKYGIIDSVDDLITEQELYR